MACKDIKVLEDIQRRAVRITLQPERLRGKAARGRTALPSGPKENGGPPSKHGKS